MPNMLRGRLLMLSENWKRQVTWAVVFIVVVIAIGLMFGPGPLP